MSAMKKCDEGHFYDPEQNSRCPFCGVGNVAFTNKADEPRPARKAGRNEDNEDRTRRYESEGPGAKPRDARGPAAPDPDTTMAVWTKGGGIDPVVGWLVCHEGPNQGRDYRIRSGSNTIGRDLSSQICIAGDDTIGRIEHAKIFYDPKNASFHLIAGNGRSGAYVNDAVVLQSVLLKSHDTVEIGSTKLTFVPFCGERFRWDTKAKAGANPEPSAPRQPVGDEGKPSDGYSDAFVR